MTYKVQSLTKMKKTTAKTKTMATLFNCADLTEFKASIDRVLPYHGISNSKFYMCKVNNVQFLVKLYFFRLEPYEIYGKPSKAVISQGDAELGILKLLLAKFINKNITPCILELMNHNTCNNLDKVIPRARICDQITLTDEIKSPSEDVDRTLCEYANLQRAGLAHNKCVFMVLEKCDLSLSEYIKRMVASSTNFAVFKAMLFEIIYTMYAISYVYPKFRHYDLHTDNIMLKIDPTFKFKISAPKFRIYTVQGVRCAIPYFGITPKLIDFGFSVIPEEKLVSNAIKDRKQMYYRADNDLILLFHWIHHEVVRAGLDKWGHIDEMLRKLEPNQTYTHFNTEYIRKVENKLPTYHDMITNSVWDEFKKYQPTEDQIYTEYTPLESVY